MKDRKLIIEVRANEYEMRDRNPHVPWTAGEIAGTAAACRAGYLDVVGQCCRELMTVRPVEVNLQVT